MPNLSVSAVCNLDCPYCFGQDHAALGPSRAAFLDTARFTTWLDFLDRSGIDEARLLGGEPTLHPRFAELVALAFGRGKRVTVFSNGLMPESAVACLAGLPTSACRVLVNMNEPRMDGERIHARRCEVVLRLGARAMLGFNFYRLDCWPDFLLDVVATTGCQPLIRVGIAHPCLSGENTFVHPAQYRALGRRITAFAELAAQVGITLDFDCGFVPCMFEAGDWATLRSLGTRTGWHCSPILDVDVRGQVIHCFPLARLGSLTLTDAADASELRRAFSDLTLPYRRLGIYPRCSACARQQSGECPGGCLSATIRRFRGAPLQPGPCSEAALQSVDAASGDPPPASHPGLMPEFVGVIHSKPSVEIMGPEEGGQP